MVVILKVKVIVILIKKKDTCLVQMIYVAPIFIVSEYQ